ncbi:MAG: DUF5996 family protein [Catalinimonas sp.]
MTNSERLPALPLEAWEETKKTLHLYLQVVGKIKLANTPRKNHWWFVTFYLGPRGVRTSPMPHGDLTFEVAFDFVDHHVEMLTSEGGRREIALRDGLTVADFYRQVVDGLAELGVRVDILARPYDHPYKDLFENCTTYHTYDPAWVNRFRRALAWIDQVFKEFSGRFTGKVSPTQLFWHSFDLATARYSGRETPMDGGTRADRDAYSHEVISAGFWAGDDNVREASFYCYTYPAPEGIADEPLQPAAARWVESNGSPMALLSYDAVRTADNPRQALLDFLESTYQAGARRAGWDRERFAVRDLT